MPVINWDNVGERTYESGLDRGVLYLPDGSAVPWNGLTSISQKVEKSVESVFYDGAKISDLVTMGSFSASLSAMTYPDEMNFVEGSREIRNGVFVGEQMPTTFGLCYRTNVGNDVDGGEAGYTIHVVYNITAVPSDRSYASLNDSPEVVEFEWELTTTPEYIDGFKPSAHMEIKTSDLDPLLLAEVEQILYGGTVADASLIPMDELVNKINNWFRVKITDHGNGMWSASSDYSGYIFTLPGDQFRIEGANLIYIDDNTYLLSDTKDIKEIVTIKIIDNKDGTWRVSADEEFISVVNGMFTIYNANATTLDANTYLLSDTI
jgi:hypothetical protein